MWLAKEQKMHRWRHTGFRLPSRFKLGGMGFPSGPGHCYWFSLMAPLSSDFSNSESPVLWDILQMLSYLPNLYSSFKSHPVSTSSRKSPTICPHFHPASLRLGGWCASFELPRHLVCCLSQDLLYRISIYLAVSPSRLEIPWRQWPCL